MSERLLDVPLAVRARLARSERLRKLVYELRNRQTFNDLFQHDRMLGDGVRIEAYWNAFAKHLTKEDTVVDLGTGTGVLAMFAAEHARQVHAIEHGPVIETAEAIAADNGFTNITFHRMNSRRFDLPQKVDAIIHEQLGDALFDEKVVENMADLRDRVLKPGGKIYPSKLDLYIEPVQLREDMRAPFAWQQRLHGIDFSRLEDEAVMSHSYLYRSFRPFPFGAYLCNREPVVSVDLETADPGDLPKRISYEREAVAEGYLDGFCVYFDAAFDDEIKFTTAPDAPATNWATPLMRVAERRIGKGDEIRLDLRAEDLASPSTWEWNWADA